MLTSTTTTMLRSGVARSCALQPVLLRSAACPYSTAIAISAPFSVPANTARASQPTPGSLSSVVARQIPSAAILFRSRNAAARRHNSTKQLSDAELDATAAAAAASSAAASASSTPLDWNAFFALRKTRRRWQLLFSVTTGLVFGSAGALAVVSGTAEPLLTLVPLDPLLTMGLMTAACGGLGWLVGPVLGSAVFYTVNRRYHAQMAIKESQFFARIKKNRVDPTNSSVGNPGEFKLEDLA
jgi:import inner membrane translocase subunit TIM23